MHAAGLFHINAPARRELRGGDMSDKRQREK